MTNDQDTDDFHVERAKEGNQESLVELFTRHRARLQRMVNLRMDQRLLGRIDASDVLQEAYVDLAQQLPNYVKDPKLPFFLWLRLITGQRLSKMHRKHLGAAKRNAAKEVSIYGGGLPGASSVLLASQLVGQFTSAGRRAVRAEMQIKMQEVLNSMDEQDREVLAMRHVEQLDNKEIAVLLEISDSTATRRYYRALRHLKDALKQIPGMLN